MLAALSGSSPLQRKSHPAVSDQFTTFNMSAAISSLVSYGSDSDSENDSESNTSTKKEDQTNPDATAHLKPLESGHTMSLALLNSAPEVPVKVC